MYNEYIDKYNLTYVERLTWLIVLSARLSSEKSPLKERYRMVSGVIYIKPYHSCKCQIPLWANMVLVWWRTGSSLFTYFRTCHKYFERYFNGWTVELWKVSHFHLWMFVAVFKQTSTFGRKKKLHQGTYFQQGPTSLQPKIRKNTVFCRVR